MEPQYYEDDDPPRNEIDSIRPDLLRGWDGAGSALGTLLKDAESRVILHPDTKIGTRNRYHDIRIHTQYRQTYADPHEKTRIIKTSSAILDATAETKDEELVKHFEEALAALRHEEERVFVAAVLGATRDLVYWNWRYGYTVNAAWNLNNAERRRFRTDVERRLLAAPELARHRYGRLVTDVSRTNPR